MPSWLSSLYSSYAASPLPIAGFRFTWDCWSRRHGGGFSGLLGRRGGFSHDPHFMMLGIPRLLPLPPYHPIVATSASGGCSFRLNTSTSKMGGLLPARGLVGSRSGVQAVKILRRAGMRTYYVSAKPYVYLLRGERGSLSCHTTVRHRVGTHPWRVSTYGAHDDTASGSECVYTFLGRLPFR